MTTIGDDEWIPRELLRSQPYSMGPVLGYREPMMLLPPVGTSIRLDNPQIPIMTCLMAPLSLRRAWMAAGNKGTLRRKIPGLAEALATEGREGGSR